MLPARVSAASVTRETAALDAGQRATLEGLLAAVADAEGLPA